MSALVIGLYPTAPVDSGTFAGYLQNLTITAYQVDFDQPTMVPGPPHTQIGSATYTAAGVGTTNTIFQLDLSGGLGQAAAAAAVINVPAAIDPAFLTPQSLLNVVLDVERGAAHLVDNDLNYDVQVDPGPVTPITSLSGVVVGLYLALPDPSFDPGGPITFLAPPADGSPPPWADVDTAVKAILAEDPGSPVDTANLSAQDCLNVARELVSNRNARPLPQPLTGGSPDLGTLYTLPGASAVATDRTQFEAALTGYYGQLTSDATRMAGYVSAWSAAQNCQQLSGNATTAAVSLPVRLTTTAAPGQQSDATVILANVNQVFGPSFEVPAEYFYGLTASLPAGVPASARFTLATQPSESDLAVQLEQASDAGVIVLSAGLTALQAGRRLAALGGARAPTELGNEQSYTLLSGDAGVIALIGGWLSHLDPSGWQALADPDAPVWADLLTPPAARVANDAAQLRLVACALTGWSDVSAAVQPLTNFVAAIGNPLGVPAGSTGLNVHTTDDLAGVSVSVWTEFFTAFPQFLPPFTQPPGPPVAAADRIAAFLQYLTRFYTPLPASPPPPALTPGAVPLLDRYGFDPLASFLTQYDSANPPYIFGTTPPGNAAADAAVAAVFPGDAEAQQWLLAALKIIDELVKVTAGLASGTNAASLEFSIIEALYARGFTSIASIAALDEPDFAEALTGSVAFQWAAQIWANAGGSLVPPPPAPGPFKPVNPHGELVDCIPPPPWSPLGPVQYLRELLDAGPGSTCASPGVAAGSFGSLIQARRGDLGGLLVTDANLETALPVADLVNECLEYLAGQVVAAGGSVSGTGGVVYDTARTRVRDHLLRPPGTPPEPGVPYHHDPATLLGALPEHSSPASPVTQPAGYAALAADYSSPGLPYAQPLDVARSYLAALKTTRYETMRRFRAQITEFVLGPDPIGFDTTVWRYPLRSDIAPEYLEISAAEYHQLFATPIATSGPVPAGELALWQLYGFEDPVASGGTPWTDVIVRRERVPAAHRAQLLRIRRAVDRRLRRCRSQQARRAPPAPFDKCEPCHLHNVKIDFGSPAETITALMQLAVFIRLWRLLRRSRCARYSFADLADICAVLGLFPGGTINPDFIPQLVAFQILRDELCLPLRHRPPAPGATGVARTPLLALWSSPAPLVPTGTGRSASCSPGWARTAPSVTRGGKRGPEFIKVLAANLGPLSRLAGFSPSTATDTWHHSPTRTLRFAEVLAKLYASPFSAGDVEYLFTAGPHLRRR